MVFQEFFYIAKMINRQKMATRILFILLALLAACTSPREALENQDYDQAYKLALANLNQGKEEKEMRGILKKSLDKILEEQTRASQRLAGLDGPENWKEALDINYGLQEKVKEARAFLPNSFEKERYALPQQAKWLRNRLYAHYLEDGRDNLARAGFTGLKEYAQRAHGAFTKAQEYAEGPAPQLDSLTQIAFRKGIIQYQVETDAPFTSYRWEIARIFEDMEDLGGGFLRVSFNEPLDDADCSIEIRFNSLETEIEEEKGDEDFNKEVILEYKTVADTLGNEAKVPVYGVVEGNVITLTRTKTAAWEADVNITALTANCSLSGRNFEAETSSVIREVRISGDKRAIPEEYLNAPAEEFRDEDDMAEELLEDLYEQIARAYF